MTDIESVNKSLTTQTEELFPVLMNKKDANLAKYERIPFDRIPTLGIGFEAAATAIQQAVNGAGGSGLYMVTVKKGGTLMSFKDGSGYLGTIKAANGGVGGGQAVLNQVAFDPTTLFMAATMIMIQKKMDAIQKTQEEILGFLEQKEKAELQGNIIVLNNIINDYKYHWNNEQFLKNGHMKAMDIKQKAEQSILFAQSRINNIVGKHQIVQVSTDVKARARKLNKVFEDYQLAMYSYAMTSYVEILMLKNFDKSYMDSVADKIEQYSIEYRELYTDCYNILLGLNDKSVDTIVIGGIGKASKAAGEAIAKIPIVSKGQFDENLIVAGEIISESEAAVRQEKLSGLVSKQSSYVHPFVENVRMIGNLHDKPMNLMFDKDSIYIEKDSLTA